MSGIAGIIHFDGAPVESNMVEKMTASMTHRGPDGIRHWVKGSAALGQCMLHTTPESLEEIQPLVNDNNSIVLVMDGRIDNWEELRREILGHTRLRNHSDAELVLKAYEIWGHDFLQHLEGDFALAIWDANQQEVFCARDRVGNKPFNYYWNGKTLVFASELHAILTIPGIDQVLNEDMLSEYLANKWYSRDETLWKGIMRLVAAHFMVVGKNGFQIKKYWQPDVSKSLEYKKDTDYFEHYRELITDVIRRMSRSNTPLAYEVSGGLDSTAMFAIAESLRQQGKLLSPAIQGYTLDFHDDPVANEMEYVRTVGNHIGVKINEIGPTQMPLAWYQKWADKYREFPSYPNALMSYGLRKSVFQNGSRVILSGVGGDEWLGGLSSGRYYTEEISAGNWKNVLKCFIADKQQLGMMKTFWLFSRYGIAPLVLPEFIKNSLRRDIYTKKRKHWLTSGMRRKHDNRRSCQQYAFLNNHAGLRQGIQLGRLENAFDIFARELEERLCSSLSLEFRRPFFNEKIIQFAFSTPEYLRLRGYTNKWMHREAMRGLLPDMVLDRNTKSDFFITYQRQMQIIENDLRHDIIPRRHAWVRPERAIELCDNYQIGDHPGWAGRLLWTLVGCDCLAKDEFLV